MTIQEEIREGMEHSVAEYAFNKPYKELSTYEKNSARNWVRLRFTELHSQGVVIKVKDRELPFNPHIIPFIDPETMERLDSPYHLPYKHAQLDMLKAGYVAVEPLIKDDK